MAGAKHEPLTVLSEFPSGLKCDLRFHPQSDALSSNNPTTIHCLKRRHDSRLTQHYRILASNFLLPVKGQTKLAIPLNIQNVIYLLEIDEVTQDALLKRLTYFITLTYDDALLFFPLQLMTYLIVHSPVARGGFSAG